MNRRTLLGGSARRRLRPRARRLCSSGITSLEGEGAGWRRRRLQQGRRHHRHRQLHREPGPRLPLRGRAEGGRCEDHRPPQPRHPRDPHPRAARRRHRPAPRVPGRPAALPRPEGHGDRGGRDAERARHRPPRAASRSSRTAWPRTPTPSPSPARPPEVRPQVARRPRARQNGKLVIGAAARGQEAGRRRRRPQGRVRRGVQGVQVPGLLRAAGQGRAEEGRCRRRQPLHHRHRHRGRTAGSCSPTPRT